MKLYKIEFDPSKPVQKTITVNEGDAFQMKITCGNRQLESFEMHLSFTRVSEGIYQCEDIAEGRYDVNVNFDGDVSFTFAIVAQKSDVCELPITASTENETGEETGEDTEDEDEDETEDEINRKGARNWIQTDLGEYNSGSDYQIEFDNKIRYSLKINATRFAFNDDIPTFMIKAKDGYDIDCIVDIDNENFTNPMKFTMDIVNQDIRYKGFVKVTYAYLDSDVKTAYRTYYRKLSEYIEVELPDDNQNQFVRLHYRHCQSADTAELEIIGYRYYMD